MPTSHGIIRLSFIILNMCFGGVSLLPAGHCESPSSAPVWRRVLALADLAATDNHQYG